MSDATKQDPTPTATEILAVIEEFEPEAKLSRDEESVVIGLGHSYIRITPTWVWPTGPRDPKAAAAKMDAPRGYAARRDEIAARLRDAGLYVRL